MVCDHSRLSSRRGAVVVVTVLMLTVILGFAALAIDIGLSQVVRGELQRTADAASLAATQDLRRGGGDSWDLDKAQQTALDFVARNPVFGDRPPICNAVTDVLLGQAEFNANGRMVNFLPGALPANAVQVSAHFELPYTFAQIFGHSIEHLPVPNFVLHFGHQRQLAPQRRRKPRGLSHPGRRPGCELSPRQPARHDE